MKENKISVFISVIVPIYNMDKYLSRCLISLEKQTYDNFEVILVDDGSTDNSLSICKEFKSRVTRFPITIIHKENGGPSSARNAGMETAKGEYVIFPDPDDWVDPDYLETFGQMQRRYPNSLCICGHYVEDKKNCYYKTSGVEKRLNRDTAVKMLFQSNSFCGFPVNKLYNLNAIIKNNLKFDIQLGAMQDLLFAFRYFLKYNDFIYNPKPLYHYYQHSGGVTSIKLTPRKISGILAYNKIIEIAEKEYPVIVKRVKAKKANFCATLLENSYKSSLANNNLLKIIKKELRNNYFYLLINNQYSIGRKLFCFIALISYPSVLHKIRRVKNVRYIEPTMRKEE